MSELEAAKEDERPEITGWRGWLRKGEDIITALALALLALLPISNIILRQFDSGIEGSNIIITHMTLIIGMLGGMLAAREKRLLSLSTAEALLKGWGKSVVQVISSSVGALVSFWLAVSGYIFVSAGSDSVFKIFGGEIPSWTVQALIPLGFAIIGLRILWNSSDRWLLRIISFIVFAALLPISAYSGIYMANHQTPDWMLVKSEVRDNMENNGATEAEIKNAIAEREKKAWVVFKNEAELEKWWLMEPHTYRVAGLIFLAVATLLGLPIFAMLGGAALLLFVTQSTSIGSVATYHYKVTTDAIFPTLPLFTLAGFILAEARSSQRLIRLFKALFGSLRGGPAIVTVAVCAFFTSFTGASGVTILALSALLMPVLLDSGYKERSALGILTGSGSLGMLFPPCLPVILYAIIAGKPIERMFLGGLLPGLLLVAMTGAYGIWKADPSKKNRQKFDLDEAISAIKGCIWELLIPVVALVGIFSGLATPVEAAALTAFYAFIVEVFIYRDLHISRDIPKVFAKCGLLIGGVLLILGVAMAFTNFLTFAKVPDAVLGWVRAHIESKYVFLLCLNGILIIVGCLMDVFSAIIVIVPLIVPLGKMFGIDPVHLGIIFLANLELGFITPPIGMNLFLSSYRFNQPMLKVCRSILPILLVQIIGVLLITYVPALTTALPDAIYGKDKEKNANALPNDELGLNFNNNECTGEDMEGVDDGTDESPGELEDRKSTRELGQKMENLRRKLSTGRG